MEIGSEAYGIASLFLLEKEADVAGNLRREPVAVKAISDKTVIEKTEIGTVFSQVSLGFLLQRLPALYFIGVPATVSVGDDSNAPGKGIMEKPACQAILGCELAVDHCLQFMREEQANQMASAGKISDTML